MISMILSLLETSPPQNIQHVSKGSDRIQITWETPATYCHAVTNYKVTRKWIGQTLEERFL